MASENQQKQGRQEQQQLAVGSLSHIDFYHLQQTGLTCSARSHEDMDAQT